MQKLLDNQHTTPDTVPEAESYFWGYDLSLSGWGTTWDKSSRLLACVLLSSLRSPS